MENYKEIWKEIFIKYSDPESALGILDISNPGLDGIYTESASSVYNFISGRSLFYLSQILRAYKELKIKNADILGKLIDGLVGAGTCSFKEGRQLKNYRSFVKKQMTKVLGRKIEVKAKKIELVNDISADVAAYFTNTENLELTSAENLDQFMNLVMEIKDRFTVNKIISTCKNEVDNAKFISDLDAVFELQQFSSQFQDDEMSKLLTKISMNYYGLYCDMLGAKPDFVEKFGKTNKLFERIVFIKRRDEKKRLVGSKAAVRYQSENAKPTFFLVDTEDSFLDANMAKPINHDKIEGILVFDKEFKFISVEEYMKGQRL